MSRINSILLTILFFLSTGQAKDLVDKVVASVNDEIVLLSEVSSMSVRLNKQGAIDETLLLGEPVESLKSNKMAQLNFLIREKLVDFEIKRLGLASSEEQAEAELQQMAEKNSMSPSDFESYIRSQGYSLSDYKNILKTRSERQRFFEKEIVSRLRISDEDAYGVFKQKYPNYRASTSEFKIAQIFFSNKKGGAAGAADRAEKAHERLLAGEVFEDLANQLDETPGSNKDGVLGSFRSGEFIPALEASVDALAVGAASVVLRGPNGFHIIKLLNRKSSKDPNFLKVKESIKASLVQQNFERQLRNWFELKKLQATIKIYKDVL